jgi:NTE family protein
VYVHDDPAAIGAPRIGLVLGGGGITGIAWLIGALEALRERTGWDPASAAVRSGTSAGAVVATVLASGEAPTGLLTFAEDSKALDAAVREATAGSGGAGWPLAWPGSLALGLAGLLTTNPRHRVTSLAGFLPRGLRPNDEIRGLTHTAVAGGWPSNSELWLHACDYRTGARVTFGRPGAPVADLADAVAASCAVPGYYRPVQIGDRQYVDGGLWSLTNADALAGEACDIVLCMAPLSSYRPGTVLDTAMCGALRGITATRLRREVKTLEDQGTRVVVVEPAGPDLRAMGLNLMDRSRSRAIVEAAHASVSRRLDDLLVGIDLTSHPQPAAALAA